MVKNLLANVGDTGSIPGSGRSPGKRIGYPLQYSCLENPMGRGALWATVHGAAKRWTQMSACACVRTRTHTHTDSHTTYMLLK